MSINLTVVVDNEEAIRRFRQLQQVAKTSTSNTVSDTDRMDMAMRRLGTAIGSLGLGFSLQQVARQIATVRGEFQQLEVAFTTMLGSKSEADMLMARTVEFAAKTPFDLQGVANGTKQLLAFGSEASEVTDEMRMLGDIAAGLSIPIGDLVYLYGTTRTQGRMFTMDLRQFMGRGIPLAEELAKQFGVTKSRVSELVTEGKVGFEDMRKALVSMTSEGGKFYNLMEEQSKTITGKLSNLEDSIQQMFNALGKESEGVITKAIDSASYLVENYEKVGRAVMDVVVAYGSYKAAMVIVNTVLNAQKIGLFSLTAAEAAHMAVLVAKDKLLKSSAVTKYLTNPYIMAGAAIGAVTFGLYKWITAKSAEEKAVERVNKSMEEYNAAQDEIRKKASEDIQVMKDANATSYDRVRAYNNLVRAYPELLERYDEEKIKLIDIIELEKTLADIKGDRTIESLESRRNEIEALLAGPVPQKAINTGTLGGVMYVPDTGYIESLKAEKEEIERQIREIRAVNKQAEFDALPADDKIKYYKQEIEALTGLIQRYTNELENADNVRKGEVNQELKAAQAKRDDLEKRVETLKKSTTVEPVAEDDEVAKTRLKAQQDANKAEVELRKAFLDDKALLLAYEKEQELKALNERLKNTTDAETRAAIEREIAAKEALYDKEMDDAMQEDVNAFALAEQEKAKAQAETLSKLLEKYNAYTRSRKSIEKTYNDDIEELERSRTATNSEVVDKAIAEAKRQMTEALEEFDMEEIGGSNLFVKLFSNASELSSKQLKSIVADTRKLVQYLDGSSKEVPLGFTQEQLETLKNQPDQVREIYDALLEKQRELDEHTNYPFSNIIKGLKSLKEAHEHTQKAISATTEEEREAAESQAQAAKGMALNYMKQGALEAANSVSFLAEKLRELAEASGNERLSETAEQVGALAQNFGAAAEGFAQGGWVGAIIGGATDMISQTIDAFTSGKAEREEERRNALDFAREYRMIMLSLKEEDYSTIFGEKGLQRAIDAYKKAQEAAKDYKDALAQTTGAEKEYNSNSMGALVFGGLWFGKSASNKWKMQLEAYKKGYTDLQAMAVKTRDYSGWANFWGKKDEYTALKDLAPELWGDDGTFNVEAAKAFLGTNTQIDDEQRKQIQNVIDLKEQYDELTESIDEQLSNIFGDLATDLTDIIFDSVRNGTDAWDAFQDRGAEAINNLGKQMVKELIVQAYLDQFRDDLRDAFAQDDPKAVANSIAQITNDMFDGMGQMLTTAMDTASAWDAAAEAAGFDVAAMDSAAKQAATARGFQAMSQDTGDELNGRFTDIQGKVTDIRTFVVELLNMGKLDYAETINIRDVLLQLRGDVADISTYTRVLPEVRDAINSMNRKLDNL